MPVATGGSQPHPDMNSPSHPTTPHLAYLLLVLTALLWAGNSIAGKLAVGHISPMTLTALRWAMALGVLLAIGGRQFWRDRHQVRRHLPILFLFGATGFAGFNITLYSALNHTSAINVAIEQAAIPALILLGNFILFRTPVAGAQILGFAMTMAGVAVVASNGSLERLLALEINRGDALMAFAGLLYATYSIALRYKPDLHWKTIMIAMAFSAMLIAIPFAVFELNGPAGIWPDRRGWLVVLYAAVFPAIVAQVFFIVAVGMIGANRAGLFINLIPIMGTVLAVLILGEVFGLHHAIAMALVIGGIWLAERYAPDAR